jgi:hypothetical protein
MSVRYGQDLLPAVSKMLTLILLLLLSCVFVLQTEIVSKQKVAA